MKQLRDTGCKIYGNSIYVEIEEEFQEDVIAEHTKVLAYLSGILHTDLFANVAKDLESKLKNVIEEEFEAWAKELPKVPGTNRTWKAFGPLHKRELLGLFRYAVEDCKGEESN